MLYCVLEDNRLYEGSTQAVLRLSGQASASSQPVTDTVPAATRAHKLSCASAGRGARAPSPSPTPYASTSRTLKMSCDFGRR